MQAVIDAQNTQFAAADGAAKFGYRTGNVAQALNTLKSPPASATPPNNGDMEFQLTSNTTLTIKVKGSDGVVRSATLTLA